MIRTTAAELQAVLPHVTLDRERHGPTTPATAADVVAVWPKSRAVEWRGATGFRIWAEPLTPEEHAALAATAVPAP